MRLLCVFAVVVVSGCIDTKPASKLTDACLVNSDCDTGLVCVFRVCHQACRVDGDCPPDSRCIAAEDPTRTLICMLPSDSPAGGCRYHSQCPAGTVCGRDLTCRNECLATVDCIEGQVCSGGLCARPSELQGDGGLAQVLEGPDCTFYDSECPAPYVCRDRRCIEACHDDRDCGERETCAPTDCGAASCPRACRRELVGDAGVPPGYGEPCDFTSQCAVGMTCGPSRTCTVECISALDCAAGGCCLGYSCAWGQSCTLPPDGGPPRDGGRDCLNDLECQDALMCNGSERCVDGVCSPALRSACDDGNPCTMDQCDEALRVCSYATSFPPDDDADGHAPVSCGGTADDCDDHAPTVYRGAVERCDFVDNNCNGLVDENLWTERSRGPLTTQDLYPAWSGAVRAAKLGNQVAVIAASDGTSRGTLDGWLLDPVMLSPQAGPIALGGSTTAWTQCLPSGTPLYGRRVSQRALGASPTELLAGGFALNYGNVAGCCTGSTGIEFVSFLNTWAPQAQPGDAGVLSVTTPFINGCDSALWYSNRSFDFLASEWNPHLSRWVLLFGQRNSNATWDLMYALYDSSTRTLGTLRPVFAGTSTEPRATLQPLNGEDGVAIASSATTTLIAWTQASTAQLRVIAFDARDPNFAQVTAGPRAVQLPTQFFQSGRHLRLLHDGASFIFSTDSSINYPAAWMRLDETTLLPGPPQQLFDRAVSQSGINGIGVSAGLVSPMVSMGTAGGFVAAESRGTGFRFAWGSSAADGGTQSVAVDLGLSLTQHTDPALVPLDNGDVALFYADGNLRRVVMQCVGPR